MKHSLADVTFLKDVVMDIGTDGVVLRGRSMDTEDTR